MALARARALAEELDRPEHLVSLTFGQAIFHMVRAEHKLGLSVAEQLEKIGEVRNNVAAQLQGRRARGLSGACSAILSPPAACWSGAWT